MSRLWAVLFGLNGAAVLLLCWSVGFILPPDPAAIAGVSETALAQALSADPDRPLQAGRTDVVVVIACALRADRLQPYGHDGPTSPFLERLAGQGVRFAQHVAQAPWSRPSVGSLLTGRWPRALGLDPAGRPRRRTPVLSAMHTTLAETLAGAGYQTFSASGSPHLIAELGFAQGAGAVVEPDDGLPDDADLVDAALDFAEGASPDEPLFAQLVLTGTRQPRQFRWRDRGLFSDSQRRLVGVYDAGVRRLDAQLARLMAGLSARRDNLLLVVVADHGEGLSMPKSHGPEHGPHLYPSAIAAPLLIHHPALPAGHTVEGLSRNLDVYPTILGLLDLPAPPDLDGLDLSAAVRGASQTGVTQVFAETRYLSGGKRALIDEQWLLIHNPRTGRSQLYDRADPGCRTAIKDRALRARLSEDLDRWAAQQDAIEPERAETVRLSEPARQKLKLIGYLE